MFITKKKHERVVEAFEATIRHEAEVSGRVVESLKKEADEWKKAATDTNNFLKESIQDVERLKTELKEIQQRLDDITNSDRNYVRLEISDDLETIVPVVGVRPDVFEALFKAGMVDDSQESNKYSHQLALMTIAFEGLSQLLEAFSEDIKQE